MSSEYDVVVVGAGLSGLCAAVRLKQADSSLRIVVLEAKERIGGRTLSIRLRSARGTDVWDLGGQWVSSSQPHILTLLEDLGLQTYQQNVDGTKLMQVVGQDIKSYNHSIPQISFLAALELHRYIQRVESLCQEVSIDDPYQHPEAALLDGMTCESYKNTYLQSDAAKELMDIAFRVTFGCESARLSALYFLWYSRAAGSMMNLFKASRGTAQELKVEGGTQQICHLLSMKVGTENIYLSHPVERIVQDEDRDIVTVITENGQSFRAAKVIMALPVSEAVKLKYTPPLPEPRRVLYANMPMGHLTKFVVTYERPFWREKGYSGEIVTGGGIPLVADCDTGPLGVVYDNTTHKGSPALVGFIAGHQGIQWSTQTPEERKSAVLLSLAKFFGTEAAQPLEYAEKIWSEEPYNGGCPVNLATPGMMQYFNKHLRMPLGRIYWAGTETSTVWCGYMNGAVQAGWRAAKEVLHDIRPGSMTEKDLYDTAYSPFATIIPYQRKRKSATVLLLEFSAIVSLVTFVAIGIRRMYFRMAL